MTYTDIIKIVKDPVTWVVVANSRSAQVYSWQKTERMVPIIGNIGSNKLKRTTHYAPVAIPDMKWEAESAEQYQTGRNNTAMVYESVGMARHMSEPHITIQEEILDHLIRAVAKGLNQASEKKAFERLVLVAPAKVLGKLKKHLSAKTLGMVTAESGKNLVSMNTGLLTEQLDDII